MSILCDVQMTALLPVAADFPIRKKRKVAGSALVSVFAAVFLGRKLYPTSLPLSIQI